MVAFRRRSTSKARAATTGRYVSAKTGKKLTPAIFISEKKGATAKHARY